MCVLRKRRYRRSLREASSIRGYYDRPAEMRLTCWVFCLILALELWSRVPILAAVAFPLFCETMAWCCWSRYPAEDAVDMSGIP